MSKLSRFKDILTAVGPFLLMVVPGGAALGPIIPIVVQAMADAEASRKTGPEKRAFVVKMTENGANLVNQIKPGTVDVDLAKKAAGLGVDTVVTTINAVTKADAELPDEPSVLTAHGTAATSTNA